MSQFSGEVFIDIGGKKRRMKFGTNATAIFCETSGKKLSEVALVSNPLTWQGGEIRDLIYAALCASAHSRDEPIDFNRWKVGDWIDEMPQAELEKVFKTINESNPQADAKKKKTE